MAKKQVYGLKSGRGLCSVCGDPVQHIKVIKSYINEKGNNKFNENIVKVCKCPSKTLDSYLK